VGCSKVEEKKKIRELEGGKKKKEASWALAQMQENKPATKILFRKHPNNLSFQVGRKYQGRSIKTRKRDGGGRR